MLSPDSNEEYTDARNILTVPAPKHVIGVGRDGCLSFNAKHDQDKPNIDVADSLMDPHMGAVYDDAPISALLSHYHIQIAPVDVAAPHAPVAAALAFGKSFIEQKKHISAAASPLPPDEQHGSNTPGPGKYRETYSPPATSLQKLIVESYVRNKVPVPSSLSSFSPKINLSCPQVSPLFADSAWPQKYAVVLCMSLSFNVPFKPSSDSCVIIVLQITARILLQPAHTPEVGGLLPSTSQACFVLHVMELKGGVRYVSTCYNSLAQSAALTASVEASFQYGPHQGEAQLPYATAPQTSATPRSQYAKLWLNPDDLGMLYPLVPSGPFMVSSITCGWLVCMANP